MERAPLIEWLNGAATVDWSILGERVRARLRSAAA